MKARAFLRLLMAGLACILVVSLPVAVALAVARHESVTLQEQHLQSLAAEAMRRMDETSNQLFQIRDDLKSGKHGRPGSPEELQRMRFLSLSLTYVQAVGRMEGTKMVRTSMGDLNPPFDLGPPSITGRYGHMWLNVMPSFGGGAKFDVVEIDGYAGFIAPDLIVDVNPNQTGLSVGIARLSSRQLLIHRGGIERQWLDRIETSGANEFLLDESVVALQKSSKYDMVAIAARPIGFAYARVTEQAFYTVPIAILVGLALALWIRMTLVKQRSFPNVLKAAIKNREFYLVYQPVVELATGQIMGAEALLRWRRSTGEMVRPDFFIPVAEEIGLMDKITDLVLDMAFTDAARMEAERPSFRIGINISPTDLTGGKIVEKLAAASSKHGVPLSSVTVEVTETGLLDGKDAMTGLRELRSRGIRVAMDDFGTGYSNLANLMKIEFDLIKIDRLFVDAIGTESATSQVINRIIEMAGDLGKEIVAEGVETPEQAAFLKERGVAFAQGYYFARPLSFDKLEELIKQPLAQAVLL